MQDTPSSRIRVLTYNIHKGFAPLQRAYTLDGMRAGIERLGCDLAFLQEVVGHHEQHARRVRGWVRQPQANFLAGQGWPHVVYHHNRVHRHGHHGNAILSKPRVLYSHHVNISTNPFERRGILHSVLEWPRPDRRLHAICVHLDLLEAGRRKQIDRILERVRNHVPEHEPVVVAGDFNDWTKSLSPILRGEAGLTEVFEHVTGRPSRSFPAAFPALALDRIYVRGLEPDWVDVPSRKEWARLSDHAPLAATLRLARAGNGSAS